MHVRGQLLPQNMRTSGASWLLSLAATSQTAPRAGERLWWGGMLQMDQEDSVPRCSNSES